MKKYILACYFILGASVYLICQSNSKSIGLGIGSITNSSSIVSDPDNRLRSVGAVQNIQLSISLKQITNSYSHRLQFSLTEMSLAHGEISTSKKSIATYSYTEWTYRVGKCIPIIRRIYATPSLGLHLMNRRPYNEALNPSRRKSTFGGSGMLELTLPYKKLSLSLYSKIYLWTKKTLLERERYTMGPSGTLDSSSIIKANMPSWGLGLELSFNL